MNFELRQIADRKEQDEEEFNKLANSLDAFTSALLNPLKSRTEDRRAFADLLDDVMDMAIDLKQKKVRNPGLKSSLNVIFNHVPPSTAMHFGQAARSWGGWGAGMAQW